MVFLMKLSDTPVVQSGRGAATKEDVEKLGDRLVWPPEFTRDPNLKNMQKLLDLEEEVINNDSLTDTEKVLRVGEYKRQYNLHDSERFEPQPLKLGAIPPKPLIAPKPEAKGEEDSDAGDDDEDDISDVEGAIGPVPSIETKSEEEEEDMDYDVDSQTDLHESELLKSIKSHRHTHAKRMLKKLAADGALKWDSDGTVYYRGNLIRGADMKKLVHYFQTSHKRNPISSPTGKVIFGEALRSARAMEDIKLGGIEDDVIREVFRGITPAPFVFEKKKSRKRHPTAASLTPHSDSKKIRKSSINRESPAEGTPETPLSARRKVVTQLEFFE